MTVLSPHFQRILDRVNKGRAASQQPALSYEDLMVVVESGIQLELSLKRTFGDKYRLDIECEGETIRRFENEG